MFLLMPESPRFLARHPERAAQLKQLLARLEQTVPPGATLIEKASEKPTQGIALADFFGGEQTRSTLCLLADLLLERRQRLHVL